MDGVNVFYDFIGLYLPSQIATVKFRVASPGNGVGVQQMEDIATLIGLNGKGCPCRGWKVFELDPKIVR